MTFRLGLLVFSDEVLSDLLAKLGPGLEAEVLAVGLLKLVSEHGFEVQVLVDRISGWHEVVHIHVFYKAFH